ncbi:flippase-like domain-containing protein [Candidatus Woesearchaeota archaeon]|nr:flippase-like domain-containing protein [Candidatus Woesearchaeota archaeon]
MNKKLFLIGSFVLGTLLFLLVLFGSGIDNIFGILDKLSWKYIGLFALVSILILIGRVAKWWIILKTKNIDIGFFRLLMCKLSGLAISFLTPVAFMGGGIATIYLLMREGVKGHLAASSVILDKSFALVANTLFTLIGTIVLLAHFAIPNNARLAIMIAPFFLLVIVYSLYKRILSGKSFIFPLLKVFGLNKSKLVKKYREDIKKSEEEITLFFIDYKKEAVLASIVSLVAWSLMFLEYKFILLAMGYNVNWIVIFSIIAVMGIAYMIPIPAALGALEGGQASLFGLIGLGAGAGFVTGLVVRARDLIWTFIGLIYLAFRGLGVVKDLIK